MINKKLLITLVLSAVILFSPIGAQEKLSDEQFPTGNTRVELQFSWLSVANFQKLDNNAQNAIVAATRDNVVFILHSLGRHTEDDCVKNLENEDIEAVKNSMLIIGPNDPRYEHRVVRDIAELIAQLCSF